MMHPGVPTPLSLLFLFFFLLFLMLVQQRRILEMGDDNEIMNNSTKAPNSFLLYKTKRRNDSNGQEVSSLQLIQEWKNMSNEQKNEFQNQSQCIQFTLDIDNRRPSSPLINTKRLPKIVVPPPSSMVIPNDHSSPTTTDLLYNHHPHPQQYHYQPHHYQHSHHQLSDLLLIPSPPIHPLEKKFFYSKNESTNKGYISYSAAAEAAALESLSFNHESTNQDRNDQSLKKKYGTLPEKVKRPPNAYLLFNRDMRRQLKHVNQGLTSGEISKSISTRWKQLSDSERNYYIQEEIKLKQLHNKQHTNFIYTRRSKAEMREADSLKKSQKTNLLTTIQPQQKKTPTKLIPTITTGRDPRGRKKKKLDASLPKHPMSGYLHFAKEMRPIMKKKCPDARLVEISKQIGSQWRGMSEKELQPWQDIANKDKQRYAREMRDRIVNQKIDEDISSVSSTCSSVNFQYKRKFSASSSTTSVTNNDTLDSHTIAAVAQMVNRNNSNSY